MPTVHLLPKTSKGLVAFARLFTLTAIVGVLGAQTPQANYSLVSNLSDSTGAYGPVVLGGTPPPAPPSASGVCHNGIPVRAAGGQDIRTPNISTLDPNDGQIDVEFNLTALPTHPVFGGPVVVVGDSQRWIGLEVNGAGLVNLVHNNSVRTPTTTSVVPGTWYSASLRFQSGFAQLFLDGAQILHVATGALNHSGNHVVLTTNDSVATALNGCIRNLTISNGTTLIGGDYQVNSPASSLAVAGLADPGAFAPMEATSPVGTVLPFDLSSVNIGLPWEVGFTFSPSVPGTAGGIATGGGQFLNLDLTDPTFGSLFNLSFTNAFVPLNSVPVSSPSALIMSTQLIVIDPASADGFALSHVNTVDFVVCDSSQSFDTATVGTPGTLPLCWSDGGGDQDWHVHSGTTSSSSTGPSGDNTTGFGNYMYCETSAPAAAGDVYILNAPPAQPTAGAVQFAYHMFGATVGTLELQELQAGTWTTIWVQSGDQGNQWTTTTLIALTGSQATLRFRYTRGSSFTGDVAIDDYLLF